MRSPREFLRTVFGGTPDTALFTDPLPSDLRELADSLQSISEWYGPGISRIVRQLRSAGALSPHTAQRYHAHSAFEERAFRWLLRQHAIRQPAPGRYYLDESRLPAHLRGTWWRGMD